LSHESPEQPAAGAETATFDSSMERLETCVERLETGQLSLEDALAVFEQGIAASRQCAGLLDQSRKRVQVLVEKAGGEFQLEFLEPIDESEEKPDTDPDDSA